MLGTPAVRFSLLCWDLLITVELDEKGTLVIQGFLRNLVYRPQALYLNLSLTTLPLATVGKRISVLRTEGAIHDDGG